MTKTQSNDLLLWMEAKNREAWNCVLKISSEKDRSLRMEQDANTFINEGCDVSWPAGEAGIDIEHNSKVDYQKFEFTGSLN